MGNLEFKCPCCGGTLNFDQKSQNIICPYCDSEFTANDLKQYTDDLAQDPKEDTSWDESTIQAYTNEEAAGLKIYSCNSCGGEIMCEETTSSTSCPYCGNNLLVSKELSGDLKPNYIIPFKTDADAAKAALKKFFFKKPLLPSSFSKTSTIEEIKNLYVPFWLFDADVNGKVRFKGEKSRTWSDSNYNYKEIKYYSLVRGGHIAFDHIPVDGSKKMQDELMESIEPFNFQEAEVFNAAYLAGYPADRYDVSKDVTFNRATERFRNGTVEAFRQDIHGYSNVTLQDSNLQLSNTAANYALYPVWTLNTKWKDKTYQFAVNGQTSKIAGNLPISPIKFALFLLGFMILFGGIATLLIAMNSESGFNPICVLLGLLIGAIITAPIMIVMWRKNKNVRFVYGASNYVRPNSLVFSTRKDIYLYRKVTKTKRQSSSSSSNKRR